MKSRMPAYCKSFACTASKCSDNCCVGWEIDIDDKTMDIYNSVGGDFGKTLRSGIDRENGCFKLKNKRCPFLNENNLCEIILNLGEDKLCRICTDHPRYYEWFDGLREGGVGMCCEEGARLILQDPNPYRYWEREIPDEDCGDYDRELADYLFRQRDTAFQILQDKRLSIGQRLAKLLIFGEKLQRLIDSDDYTSVVIEENYPTKSGNAEEIINVFLSLEPIDDKWRPMLEEIKTLLSAMKSKKADFIEDNPHFVNACGNIAVYFIWRYFMKGTFDGEILSKLKLAAVSVIMIGLSAMNVWLKNGTLTMRDCVIAAKNYSKEIEYSEENLDVLADCSYDNSAFSTENLSALLV